MFLKSIFRISAFLFVFCCFAVFTACTPSSDPKPPPPVIRYTVTATAGEGTTISPASVSVDSGYTASFTVTLLAGYSNLTVTGGNGTLAGNTYVTSAITANTAIASSATRGATYYVVTANAGEGTAITPSSISVEAGKTATFTVTLLAGYTNLTVTGGNGTLWTNTYVTSTINANTVVTSSATKSTIVYHTITASADSGAYILPTTILVEHGKSATFKVTADSFYKITTVTGLNGILLGDTYTISSVTENGSVRASTDSTNGAYMLNWLRITPNVLFDDEFATMPVTIEAYAYGAGIHLSVGYLKNTFDKNQPDGFVSVTMYDDGTHGDRIAGDHIYTATFAAGIVPHLRYYGNTVDALSYSIQARDDAGISILPARFTIIAQMGLGVVSRSLAVTPTQISADVFAAPNMVNVVMPDFQLNTMEQDVMKRVYSFYPDVFTGCVLQRIGRSSGNNGEYGGPVKNTVLGINVPLSDNSASFGSNGVLASLVSGPIGDITSHGFLHEHGHSAGMYLNRPELNLTADGFHTAYYTTAFGQMGGNFNLVEQSSGDFLVVLPDKYNYMSRQYADLELYLMGLVPPSTVQPMRFILGAAANDYKVGDIIPRSATTLVTIDDIIRVNGARTPAYADSQKSTRTVFVGISEKPMTSAEISLMNRIAIYYASDAVGGETDDLGIFPVRSAPAFKAATKGNGTLVTVLPPRK